MILLANILIGLGQVLSFVLQLYMWILIGRAIISWVNADPRNGIVRFLRSVTDPPVEMIRRRLPRNLRYFPLDIAFLVLFALVIFAQFAVAQSLIDLGQQMRLPAARGATDLLLSRGALRATLGASAGAAMTAETPTMKISPMDIQRQEFARGDARLRPRGGPHLPEHRGRGGGRAAARARQPRPAGAEHAGPRSTSTASARRS